jgi:hypothetical protein
MTKKVIIKQEKCKIDLCKNKVRSVKHGLCASHVRILYKKGVVENKPVREYKSHTLKIKD